MYFSAGSIDDRQIPVDSGNAIRRCGPGHALGTERNGDFDGWNDVDTEVDDDDQVDDMGTCTQYKTTKSGTYTSFLFDLINDPYETTNLYDDDKYSEVIEELQAKLKEFKDNSRTDAYSDEINKMCYRVWKAASNVIVPWTLDETSGEGYQRRERRGDLPSAKAAATTPSSRPSFVTTTRTTTSSSSTTTTTSKTPGPQRSPRTSQVTPPPTSQLTPPRTSRPSESK
jgi:hypothetical protein